LKAAGLCLACAGELDTPSKRLCRGCLDKNRNRKRRVRNGTLVAKHIFVCPECYGLGHREAACQMRGKAEGPARDEGDEDA
jgi:hypothetical protein